MQFPISRPVARLTASVALAGTIGLSGGAAALAQDATPAGTPIGPDTGQCMVPDIAATASPVADDAAIASPVVEDALPGGAAVEDEAVIAEATAVIENLYACYNSGDGEAVLALLTENGHEQLFARVAQFSGHDHEVLAEYISARSAVAQAGAVDVHEVIDYGDGTLGVDYQVSMGKQVIHVTDILVDQGGAWLIDDRVRETPETSLDSTTAAVQFSVADGSVTIEVSPSPIMNQPAVRLQLDNQADSPVHVVLFQGGDAASVTSADLTSIPEGVTFIGEADAEPGSRVDTLFEGLEEGSYVIVAETTNGETGSFDLTIDPPFDPEA